jgi:DNA-binding transcriptional MerR regulator
MDGKLISDYDHPSYNIKAVAQMVGLLPVTLRAWERRYGLPSPMRGGQGYRLYSEHDLQTLRWLKSQLESGMNIGQAAQRLHQMVESGNDPTAMEFLHDEHSLSLSSLQSQVATSLKQLNSQRASQAYRQALNTYPVEEIFSGLIEPIMIRIGEDWQKGQIPVAEEHFASEFFQEHLLSMLNVTVPHFRAGTIMAGCMPGEQHQIGLVMIVILLRMRGWNVAYFGSNLHLDRLEEVTSNLNPRLILFSATLVENAKKVLSLVDEMRKISRSAINVILGGQGFVKLSESNEIPHLVLSGSNMDIVHAIEKVLEQNSKR